MSDILESSLIEAPNAADVHAAQAAFNPESVASKPVPVEKPEAPAVTEPVKPEPKKTALDKLGTIKKPEPAKVDLVIPEKTTGNPNENNVKILRQAKEELDRLKPEYEKTKGEFEKTRAELTAEREELTKLKALGLNEKEREEYSRYRDLHAVDAVQSSDQFQKNILQPIQYRRNKLKSIAKNAGLPEDALIDHADIADDFQRNKAIRASLQSAQDLDAAEINDLVGKAIAIADDLNEKWYPKMDEVLANAGEIEKAARQHEQGQHQEMTKKQQAEFQKEHEGMYARFKNEILAPIFNDTDLSIEGTTLDEALKNSRPGTTPQERAAEVHALASYPFLIHKINRLLQEKSVLENANKIRNGSAPSRSDGQTRQVTGRDETLKAEEVFGNRRI